jgi:Na+/phosphate symporter
LLGAFNFYVGLDIEMPFWNKWKFLKRRPAGENRPPPERVRTSEAAAALAAFYEDERKNRLAQAKAEVLSIADYEERLTNKEYEMIRDYLYYNDIQRAMDIIRNAQQRPANGGRRSSSSSRSRRSRRTHRQRTRRCN